MKQFTHNLTPKKGNYLIGAIVFGMASIFMFFVMPQEIAPIGAGFFGIFFLISLFLYFNPSAVGAKISSEELSKSSSERLSELMELHSKGFLTDEEFRIKRESIIKDI
jgi:uncharacterized membrane protein